jgi:type IV secretion system protein VirD4
MNLSVLKGFTYFIVFYSISSSVMWYEAYTRGRDFNPFLIFRAFKHYGFWDYPPNHLFMMIIAGFVTILPTLILAGGKSKYGKARFAHQWDIEKLGINYKKGLLLGRAWNRFVYLDKPLSLLLIAPPGTGKTAGFVVPQVLTMTHSAVIDDPKGEIYRLTAKAKGKQDYNVLLFNPNHPESCKFNILDRKLLPQTEGKRKSFIGNVAEILIRNPSKSGSNEFFYQKARTAFAILANYIILTEKSPSFILIRKLIGKNVNVAAVFNEIKDNPLTPEWLQQDCNIILQETRSREQWSGIIGTLTSALEVFGFNEVAEATSGDSHITAENLRNQKTIVYIKIDTDDRERLAPLVALVFYSLGIQLTTHEPSKEQQRVTFIIDEFPVLGRVNPLVQLPAISRGYNLNIEFIAQDFDQIAEIYGRETIGILQTNCAYKIVLQQNNRNTAESFSRDIGNKTDKKTQSSSQGFIKTSISSSQEGLPLISAQEIMHLNASNFILLCQGSYHLPVIGDIPFYFKDPVLVKMVTS